ncbi:MAG TPA: hypothetical protein VLH61_02295 [Bacteroidales bacterium]|nr:hypothetical protein [Bacteroidales bacterium]
MNYTFSNHFTQIKLTGSLFILLFFLSGHRGFPLEIQTDTTKINEVDTHSVFAGFSFSNYPSFLQPANFNYGTGFATHLLYSMVTGVWVEVRVYHIPGFNPFISLSEISTGYNHIFSRTFDAGFTLTRLMNHLNPPDPLLQNATLFNLNLGVDWSILYTNLMPGWIWTEEPDFFLAVQNTRFFQSGTFGKNNSYFTANPGFLVLLGSEVWYRRLSPFLLERLRRRGWTHLIPELSRMEGSFRLQSLIISIPLSLETWPWSFELEPTMVFSLNNDAIVEQPEGLFLNLGVFIKIF